MPANDEILKRVFSLAIGQLEGTLSDHEQGELSTLILDSQEARRAYIQFVEESACLRWMSVEDAPELAQPTSLASQEKRLRGSRWANAVSYVVATACMLLVAVGASQWMSNRYVVTAKSGGGAFVAAAKPAGQGVATITGLESVRWENPVDRGRLLGRCDVGDRIRMQSGAAQLTFDAGVQVTVFAPADFKITSATSISCARGRVTALVGERGKGFTIHTPQAKVVDLGTQFGLDISDEGETEVVVFQGSVDLTPLPDKGEATTRRMSKGEALLLKTSGELERVVSVQRNSFIGALDSVRRRVATPVISDVRDNIRTDQSVLSYQIVHAGFDEDAPCFVDRDHQWNGLAEQGLPSFLVGADYVMPFNDDKFVRGLNIDVTLDRPASLYVILDNNMAVPAWLRREFVDTGIDIGLDGSKTPWHQDHSLSMGAGHSIDFQFSVWKREVRHPGRVRLGGIEPPAVRSQGFNMYGIAAVPLE